MEGTFWVAYSRLRRVLKNDQNVFVGLRLVYVHGALAILLVIIGNARLRRLLYLLILFKRFAAREGKRPAATN